MSARQEKVREALERLRLLADDGKVASFLSEKAAAALVEVEEWETRLSADPSMLDDLLREIARAEAAEAEADRLKAALTTLRQWDMLDYADDGPWAKRLIDAALAPADRNTT